MLSDHTAIKIKNHTGGSYWKPRYLSSAAGSRAQDSMKALSAEMIEKMSLEFWEPVCYQFQSLPAHCSKDNHKGTKDTKVLLKFTVYYH